MIPESEPGESCTFRTALLTKAVVAICVELLSNAGVGAVGVPVNEGDSIVARNNISAVFAVILAVLELIRVSNPASAFVALVISAVILDVLDVILVLKAFSALVALVISAVILAVFALIAVVLLVMLAVLDDINVGSVAMVEELTPPTLLVVVVNTPVPLPLTSPVKVIV